MLAAPRVLSIMTTRRCTAACDHCCVGASPRATAAIPIERIRSLIDEATRIPSIERIGFTGGECFVLGKNLDALVRHAAARGFITRAITNGYWAVHARAARERVAGLRESGLDEMMVSTGTFHQAFVPVERVVHAARAAAEAGIMTRVSVETCDQSSFDDTVIVDALRDLVDAHRIVIARDPWTTDAGGRGHAVLTHESYLAAADPRIGGACPQVLDVITVTPDQQLISCCGFPLEELPRLRIGSVAGRALDDVLKNEPNELVKMWLHVAGPSGIAAFVAQHLPGWSLPQCATMCQACVTLQRDERAMRVLSQHAHEIVNDVAAQYLALQTRIKPRSRPPIATNTEEYST
jgi:hypothetical protein